MDCGLCNSGHFCTEDSVLDPNGFNELKLCRTGPLLFNKNDWPIGVSLQEYGEFSWSEVDMFQQIIKPGQTVIDAGANIGCHTVVMSQLVGPTGLVIAFEPQRIAFQTLCANVALNNCVNVSANQMAIGAKQGLIKVPLFDPYQRRNFGGAPMSGVTEGEDCVIVPLDAGDHRALHFIKADVEGMEGEFLEGAKKTIAKHRPAIYMEADGAQKVQAMMLLLAWEYRLYWHVASLFNPENFAGNRTHRFMMNGSERCSINVICLPREAEQSVQLTEVTSPYEDGMTVHNDMRRAAVG